MLQSPLGQPVAQQFHIGLVGAAKPDVVLYDGEVLGQGGTTGRVLGQVRG